MLLPVVYICTSTNVHHDRLSRVRTGDRIDRVRLSLVYLPLSSPISDEVPAGRRQPVTEVAFLFAELGTTDGHAGLGFSYATRAGGPALYAHGKEIVPLLLGEDPNDIGRVREKLVAAGVRKWRGGVKDDPSVVVAKDL